MAAEYERQIAEMRESRHKDLIRKAFLLWHRRSLSMGFRTWVDKHFKLKKQAQEHQIMRNFIIRLLNKQQSMGFYKWFEVVSLGNKKRRFIKKAFFN